MFCASAFVSVANGRAQGVASGNWPWGVAVQAGRGDDPGFDALDLWNLGMLGAKATDADVAPRVPREARVLREVPSQASSSDSGPRRLRVAAILPGGPAERAGLRLGDVITAIDGATFEKGSRDVFAAALRPSPSSSEKPRRVTLRIERRGAPVGLTIQVSPAADDVLANDPVAARHAIGMRALDWLVMRQTKDGGFPETLSGVNGVVVQASLAGLAWLAGEDGTFRSRRAAALEKATTFVMKNVSASDALTNAGPDGANWNQTNWGYVHAAIFLGELCARRPTALLKRELQRCADVIARNQSPTGGWGHGPGGRNSLGYVELNILSGLALNALGLAKQAGCSVDEGAIRRAKSYLESSMGADGGVGYSTERGQIGIGNIGRTAAAWLGYVNLGFATHRSANRMQAYVGDHAGDFLGGHASLMQQILLAGAASQAIGGEAENRFWASVASDLTLARCPDGSLQPRPWHESLQLGANCDVMTGSVWTTACWSLVLLAAPAESRTGLPALFGRHAASR